MGECAHVCPQFHLPVQSGNDEILRAMNRHYDRAAYLDKVERLRQAVPGIGLTTDIIVGFPGETFSARSRVIPSSIGTSLAITSTAA